MQNEQAGKKLAAHGKWLLIRGGHNSRCDFYIILYMYLHCLLCVGPPMLFCSLIIINDGMKRNARVLKISIIGFENQMIFSNLNNSKEFELLTLYRTFHMTKVNISRILWLIFAYSLHPFEYSHSCFIT